jgi:predicted ATPase/DNA-binding winged helix-turn-helix (wHTH) protein
MNASLPQEAMHFDNFVVLPAERRLLVCGQPAKIGARAFDLLLVLLSARDRVVSKNELLERVWPGVVVEENNLSVHVSQLRKVCGPRSVATIPGRGYQFTAPQADTNGAVPRVLPGTVAFDTEPPSMPVLHGNLPAQLPQLIGREVELAEVREMLSNHRWVTISGAGGMGKTRLAEAAGKELAALVPVWIVELASVNDPRLVPNAVAQTLGANIVDTERPVDAIISALHGPATLLILDNCEHLVAAVSDLCRRLLGELPLLRVLITSQELLRNSEEAVYKLGPLTLPDSCDTIGATRAGAVQLLNVRVQALVRHFAITPENVGDAIVICQQLDGLPLAVELAAGRVPMLGLAGVRDGLGELFRLLTGDSRLRLRRHQTLRAALDWSYQLLLPQERALLRRLGVFSGTFSIEGVRHIASDIYADDWGALETLSSLIDKSMVQVKGIDRPRYLMLETTRAYALEQLAQREETEDALARHADATRHVCALAKRMRDTQAIWSEITNIRAAFDWGIRHDAGELAVALVNDSSVVLALGGLVGEVVQRLVEVEPFVTEQFPRPAAAQYRQWLGRFGHDGRLPADRCVAALEKAEELYRELCNDRHVHACLRMRAEALTEQGNLAAARRAIDATRDLETPRSPVADKMRRLRIEARILEASGDVRPAIRQFEEALEIAKLAEIHRYVVMLTQDIGRCLLQADDAAAAEVRFRTVIGQSQVDLSTAVATAYARIGLVTALLMQGEVTAARVAALDAVPLLRSCGMLHGHSEVFAWLMALLGRTQTAAVLLRTADAFRSTSGIARGQIQISAYQTTREKLGDHAHTPFDAIASDVELAKILTASLIGAERSAGIDASTSMCLTTNTALSAGRESALPQ